MTHSISRQAVIAQAMTWLGTPYQHQASQFQVGCDCLGLLRGVWRHFYGQEPQQVPPYTPDWAERAGKETLRDAAELYFTRIPLGNAKPGDVLLFRMHADAPAKHVAILTQPSRMIHAYWGRAVTETALTPYWSRRRAYAYAFSEIAEL